jgi:hypothetical protein
MAQKKTTKGALGKDPSKKEAVPFDVARATKEVNYLLRVRPNDPSIRRLQSQIKKANAKALTVNAPPAPPSQEERVAQAGGDVFEQMSGYAKQFDPRTFQSQYEPVYSQEMERARQNVLGQFERRNVEEFGRQTQELERSIAERGLDPAGEAAQSLRKQLTQRQDLARQEAMSAAESASDARQQAMYGQSTGTALLPQQIASGFLDPYMQSQQQQFAGQQGDLAFEREKQLAAKQHQYNLQTIAKTPRGGGGGQQPDYYGQYLLGTLGQGYNQTSQINPYAAAAQGGTAAFANVFGQNLGRKVGS